MASSAPNKVQIGRAAAILVDASEVAGTSLDLNRAWGSRVTADLTFTKGSLTNAIFRAYVSMDGSTWWLLYDESGAGAAWTKTFTVNTDGAFTFPNLAGWKHFRMSAEGTGTATGSSAAFNYRYLRRGSQ